MPEAFGRGQGEEPNGGNRNGKLHDSIKTRLDLTTSLSRIVAENLLSMYWALHPYTFPSPIFLATETHTHTCTRENAGG